MDISKQIQNIIPLIHMGMGGRGGGGYRSYSYRAPAPEKFKIFTAWLPSYTVFSLPLLIAERKPLLSVYLKHLNRRRPGGPDATRLIRTAIKLSERAAESLPAPLTQPLQLFGLTVADCDAACAGFQGHYMALPATLQSILDYTGPEISSVAYCADPAVCAGVLARCSGGFFRAGAPGDYTLPNLWRTCIVEGLEGLETRQAVLRPEQPEEEKKS